MEGSHLRPINELRLTYKKGSFYTPHKSIRFYQDFLGKVAIAIPLWFAGVSFGMMFLVIFPKKKIAIISYYIMSFVIPRIIMVFAAEPFKVGFMRVIRKYTITQNISLVPYPADPSRNVTITIVIGLLYGTIATVIGCIYYKKSKMKTK